MKKKSIIISCLTLSASVLLVACGETKEEAPIQEEPIVLKKQQETGVNTSALNNDSNYSGSKSTGTNNNSMSTDVETGDVDGIIDKGGIALVEAGLVSSEDKLMTEQYMHNMSSAHIMNLRAVYGQDKSLAEDIEKTMAFLKDTYELPNEEDLENLADLMANVSNKKDNTIVISHNIHALKQLSDDSFAVYFYVRAEYKNEVGDIFDKLETPYHIMTLEKRDDDFKVVDLSISSESYLKFEDDKESNEN